MVREGKGQVVCIAHLTAVGRNVCPAPAVIHGMYKLEEEKKKKVREVKRKMGVELVPALRQVVHLPLEK